MKKVFLFALACFAFAGCSNQDKNGIEGTAFEAGQQITLGVSMAGNEDASNGPRKIGGYVSGDEIKFVWETDDAIAVKQTSGSSKAEFTITSSSIGKTYATFTGTPSWSGTTFNVEYPYSGQPSLAAQKYQGEGKLPTDNSNHSLLWATASDCNTDNGIVLEPQVSILQLPLTGNSATIGSIEVWAGATPAKIITLDCGTDVVLGATAKNFLIIITPGTYTNFTIKVLGTDASELYSVHSTADITFTKGSGEVVPTQDVFVRGYVDLGLSVMWANCNIGANAPEDYGDYFAWGATTPWYEAGHAQENPQTHWKEGYSDGYCSAHTPYYDGSTYTKYTSEGQTLEPCDDAAHVIWGGKWRMPTKAEFEELKSTSNCTWTETTLNGKTGFLVTSKKAGFEGNSIFIPYGGQRQGTNLEYFGRYYYYWTSTKNGDYKSQAWDCHGQKNNYCYLSHPDRCWGNAIRPVCP